MDTTPTRRAMMTRWYRGPGMFVLTVLVLVGALIQACSDNSGPAGPKFPAGQTGTADTAGQVLVFLTVNPNGVPIGSRAGITVLATNVNGQPLAGRHVQLSATQPGGTIGQLDVVDGFTDKDGKFVSFFRCDSSGQVTVAAVVQGQANVVTPQTIVSCNVPLTSSSSSSSAAPTATLSLIISSGGTVQFFVNGALQQTFGPSPACSVGTPCTAQVAVGASVTLQASSSTVTWSGFASCTTGTLCSFTMTSSGAVGTASF